jgi:hypothetical protein
VERRRFELESLIDVLTRMVLTTISH